MTETVDVVVAGGGVAGLVAARQLAHLGHSVLVVEERDALGGFVGSHEVAGVELDSGAESYATRAGTVAALVEELGLGSEIVTPAEAGAWVAWNGGAAPLPAAGLLGIPGVPLADDVRRVVGWSGSLRAYLDRLMPLLRVRKETDLGDIVRRRMGRKVLDRLVTPVVAGVHSADPSVVDVHAVAPGLTQAMTTQGSLSGAVMALREQAPAGSKVQGLVGGMHRLVEALETDCLHYGVQVAKGAAVTRLEPVAAGEGAPDARGWRVAVDDGDGTRTVTCRAVVVATGFRPALALLRGALDEAASASLPADAEWPDPASVTLATLVVDEPRLDAAPRGTGVLVAAGTPGVGAKALTHATAKWAWLAERLPAHRHVLRLSYGSRGAAAAPGAGDPRLADVLRDASALLGVPLSESDVRGFSIVHWHDSLAFATVGHRDRVRRALAAVAETAGLDTVGAWVSGTGLAATVAHARTTGSQLAAELRGQPRLD
ncbi:FAD-dependent oxidoreductase [Herbiconiux moechotypicola]|uniref:Protoporphyrinogen oxidase n=1 Tax=Herbiconiux moechotypicola TaxID=637393 RepID=A0ABP5Q6D0_9MICO|nr:FAD-dependent oxidoreductase [Herbiconiux moechotypicola]MCS5728852.1 FAD-dependent oxidoreductase [Herbiconiux moechotypicola]